MDPRSLLLARIDALWRELVQVEESVASPQLDKALRERVGPWFDQELSREKLRVEGLRKETANNEPLETCWTKFRTRESRSRKLFDETLAFIQGALSRAAKADEGLCVMADRLLEDLSHWSDAGWNRFTLLDTGEFYGEAAEIIRVRFPETSIWSLPLAAHEFGHYLGPELREKGAGDDEYPLRKMLEKADERHPKDSPVPHSRDWHHLHEHWADLFATRTLGPAFACAFMLLRLNPADAYEEGHTHPSHAKRVHSILWKLTKMDKEAMGPSKPYRDTVEKLREAWRQSLKAAGQRESLSDPETSLLEGRLERLDDVLTQYTPSKLAYQAEDWWRAVGLISKLHPDEPWHGVEPAVELTRRDVLNAAWSCRLELDSVAAYLLAEIGRRAVDLYERIPPRGT